MILNLLVHEVKGVYKKVIKEPSLENPIAAIITSIALKILGFFTSYYASYFTLPPYVGLIVFSVSLIIDFAIISNFSKVRENIKTSFMTPEERAKKEGEELREDIEEVKGRISGFFHALTGSKK